MLAHQLHPKPNTKPKPNWYLLSLNSTLSLPTFIFLDPEIKQQTEAKKLQRSKESKNSQKVNDILQRLSSYTNTPTNNNTAESKRARLKQLKAKRHPQRTNSKQMRSSSISSLSSLASQINSHSDDSSRDEDSDLNDSNRDQSDCSQDHSEFESSSMDEDTANDHLPEDPFKIHENCNHDLEEFEFGGRKIKEG